MRGSVLIACVLAACGGTRATASDPAPVPQPSQAAVVTVPEPDAEDAGAPSAVDAPRDPFARSVDSGTTSSSSSPSDPVRALGAIARGDPSKRWVFLLRAPAEPRHCGITDDDDDFLMGVCSYAPGTCSAAVFSLKSGQSTSYRVRLQVLSAPATQGARGKLRIEERDGNNVLGGEIEILVCP